MRLFILFFALQFAFLPTKGQQKKQPDCWLCKPVPHINKNPYNVNLKKEWPYLLGGTAVALTGYFIKANDNVTPFTPQELNNLNRENINSLDRGATYNYSQSANNASDIVLVSSLIVMPQLFLFNKQTNSEIGTLLVLTYEVATINYGLTNLVKSMVNRSRPYVYNPELTYEERTDADSRFSFYSGHTSVTASFSFLFAKTLSDFHPNMTLGYKIGVWSFAALLPATTGYLRIKAGQHYPTDVIVGYAIGALTGWLVPQLHKRKKQNISIYPTRLFNTNAVGFSYTW